MSKLTLTYFDFDGGRGEPTRLAFHLGGVEFEDFRFTYEQFQEVIIKTPLKQVPTLQVDDNIVTQCNAQLRYAGKMVGLYPNDAYQALLCDEILEAIEDPTNALVRTFGLEDDELKQAREALASGVITRYLKWLNCKLESENKSFFVGERLTVADLKVFVWTRSLISGILDHIPTTLVAEVAPKLIEHLERVTKLAGIEKYYEQRK